jgi:hypothetical protein
MCNREPVDNRFIRRASVYGDLKTLATIKGTEVSCEVPDMFA